MDVTSYRASVYTRLGNFGGNLQGKIIINNRYIISMFGAVN